jgi:hypothetical protein
MKREVTRPVVVAAARCLQTLGQTLDRLALVEAERSTITSWRWEGVVGL